VAAGDEQARLTLAQRLLSQGALGTDSHERGLAMLLAAATGARALEAYWLLGAYHLMVTARAGAVGQARHWLGLAAAAGVAPAIDRLADLDLRGLGRPVDVEAALRGHQLLADRGFYRSAWFVGYLMGHCPTARIPGLPDTAAGAFARACALGYPQAYLSLGIRVATGDGVAADRDLAKALLLRAADGRVPMCREAIDTLLPGPDSPEVAQWHARLKQNLDAAQPMLERLRPPDGPTPDAVNPLVPALEAHLAGLGHPAFRLDPAGRLQVGGPGQGTATATAAPPRWHALCGSPRVALAPAFASLEERAHLVGRYGPMLTQPRNYASAGSSNDDAELMQFSGVGAPVRVLDADPVVRTLEQRVARLAQWPVEAMEPCSIIRYQAQQAYEPHVDYFTPEQVETNRRERGDPSGQRVATFLLYLVVPDAGGVTHYHVPGISVAGEPGLGVIHYNTRPDGAADPDSLHSGSAIVAGEKWLWRSTLRERAIVDPGPGPGRAGTPLAG
jgi:prolyl 4-hydroxylase